jgi:hypothetical protein
MSDYNPEQQRIILEQIADEENHSSILPDQEESQPESPSFCELVSTGRFDRFQYSHAKDTTDLKYSAAENFLVREKSLSVIFAMAIGHENFQLLINKHPFKETKQRTYTQVFRPANAILSAEVVRRAHFIFHGEYKKVEDNPLYNPNTKQIRMPKPAGWSRQDLLNFLESKTIKLGTMDVAFIHSQIFLYSVFLTRELKTQELKPEATSWDRGSWEGIVPNVRLIEIVLSDDFRLDFINRNDAESRQQLDARGTEAQKISFWEKVRRRFNDRNFKVNSCPLEANWGRDTFIDIHDCNWAELDALGIAPITDEKTCKLNYSSLNNKLGTVYKNWKASGNGEHQVAGSSLEEAEYGKVDLEKLPTQGGDRIDFLGKYNICVMYLWFSLIKAGAFLYSQTEFPEALQADDGIAPKIKIGGGSSIGSSGGSTSSKSSSTRNKKVAATKVETEMDIFSRNIERLNNSMLLDSEQDRLHAQRRELKDDIKDLKKEVNVLFHKTHEAEVAFLGEMNDTIREVKKKFWERMCERYNDEEATYLKKEEEMNALQQKIDFVDRRLFEIREKTPKRSGNSSKETRNRAVPNSIVVTADDDPAVAINFDTPAAGSTPTVATSQLNELLKEQQKKNKKRKQVDTPEESIDLLAQKTPSENEYEDDDDNDDDDELFQKVL